MIRTLFALSLICSTASAATISLTPAPGLSHVWVNDASKVLNFTQVGIGGLFGVGGGWLNFGNDPVPGSIYTRDFYTDAFIFSDELIYLANDDLVGISFGIALAPDVYVSLSSLPYGNTIEYEISRTGFSGEWAGSGWTTVEHFNVPEPTSLTALPLVTLFCVRRLRQLHGTNRGA